MEEKSDARLGGREHDKLFGTVVLKGIDSDHQGGRNRIKAVVFSQSMETIFNQLQVKQIQLQFCFSRVTIKLTVKYLIVQVGEVYTISNAEVIRTNQSYPDRVQNPTQLILNINSGTKVSKRKNHELYFY